MAGTFPSRRRGRPAANGPAPRELILDALIALLEKAPLTRPSLRAVAQGAGVAPALLHYHFTDLPGLLNALHAERARPLLRPLVQDLIEGQAAAGPALARFLQKWTTLCLRHRWLVACLLQISDVAQGSDDLGGFVRRTVAAAQRQGTVRADLPDSYVALLLLSLGALPHLAQTALGAGTGGPSLAEPEHGVDLTLRHLAVLQAGVAT